MTKASTNERTPFFSILPPAFGSIAKKRDNPKSARNVKSPSSNQTTQSLARKSSMERMTQAFRDSMRCSPDEAESKTSEEDRTNCIDVGKLLSAMDEMKKCMEVFGMQRGPNDLKAHIDRVELLYKATPLEKRDCLSGFMSSKPYPTESLVDSLTRKRSISISRTEPSPIPPSPPPLAAAAENDAGVPGNSETNREEAPDGVESGGTQTDGGAENAASPSETTSSEDNDPLESPSPQLLQIDRHDRKNAKQSMFWLCYYVRYLYEFHRLVLQRKHDPVDASTMSFMQFLYPYFKEYYDSKDAKKFLKVVADYRTEHFLGQGPSVVNKQPSRELSSFLAILEVVMYLWTPALKEMALKGRLINQ
ncbi:unnamed protein product [Pseudo-nitzschia multistriata]|uniref:Uncharacterized protein n=1 Tax=Pseudo-nitzschia multistriata TaxID=183589 RepID=A0A448Z9E3_9STRA|nr:unnamed protein product [Pseudo-nitzschia multistriata]